jgi:inorganic triphosphatase YgiF
LGIEPAPQAALPTHEAELKFGVPAERLDALKKALARGTLRNERLYAEYFDTEDDRLARHRVGLRLRKEGRHWVQTVKAATDDIGIRLEDNAPVAAAPPGTTPALDLARHDGTPAGAALRKALAGAGHAAEAALAMRYGVDVRRAKRTISHAGAKIELALDVGRIVASGREEAVCELELELVSGPSAALFSLAERWLAAHGLWLAAASKAERGTRLARGELGPEPVRARPARLDGGRGTAAFMGAVARSCLEQIVGNASALAADTGSEEHIHQLRVGMRRLRTALRELGDFAATVDASWEPALREAFHEFGAHRDQTMVLPRWAAELAAAGAPPLALPAAPQPLRSPQAMARDPRLQRTLLALVRFAQEAAAPDPGASEVADCRAQLALHLERLHRQIGRDAKRFARLDGDAQHRTRKRLKRLRYLSEFAAPLFAKKAVGRYLEAMSRAQDELGNLNDERIAEAAYRRDSEQNPRAWFAAGWIAARRAETVRGCERALKRVAKASPFWKAAPR